MQRLLDFTGFLDVYATLELLATRSKTAVIGISFSVVIGISFFCRSTLPRKNLVIDFYEKTLREL